MDVVLDHFENDIYTITLNRPKTKNAMDFPLLRGLFDALTRAREQQAPFVVIRGAGGAFSSGGDLVAFKEAEDAEALIDGEAGVLHESIKTIRKMNAVVIAVVEGVAVGAGVGLSLACDLTIAARNTVMNMGYRRIGLTPDGGGSFFLPRLVGSKRFNEFYLLSRNITMEDALELGLVNVVCEPGEIEERLASMIRDLKALPMETIGYFKNLVNMALFPGLETHLDKERFYVAELAARPLFKQRLEDFFKRR